MAVPVFCLVWWLVAWSDARAGRERNDFLNYSLRAAEVISAGQDPYDREIVGRNYNYFPLNATLLLPLTHLSHPSAQGFWTALNLYFVVGIVFFGGRLAGREGERRWVWAVAVLLAARFFADNLKLGQWNTSVCFLTFLGLYLVACRRPLAGGISISLAAGLKYMPVFFLPYLLLKKQWKASLAMVCGAAFWILVLPSVVLGPKTHAFLFRRFIEHGLEHTRGMVEGTAVNGHSLFVFVYRLMTPAFDKSKAGYPPVRINLFDFSPGAAENVALIVVGLLVIFTLWVLFRGRSRKPREGITGDEVALVFAVLLMVSPEARKAQFLTLFLPFTVLLAKATQPALEWRVRIPAVACLAWSAAMLLLSSRGVVGGHLAYRICQLGSYTSILVVLFASLAWYILRGQVLSSDREEGG